MMVPGKIIVALVLAMILMRVGQARPASSARSSTCRDITPPVADRGPAPRSSSTADGHRQPRPRPDRHPGAVLDDRPDLDQAEPRDHGHLGVRRDDGDLPRRAVRRPAATSTRRRRWTARRRWRRFCQHHAADDQPGALLLLHHPHDRRACTTFTRGLHGVLRRGRRASRPRRRSSTSIYLFRQAFEYFNMGFASAMAWLLFAIIMIVTADQDRRQPALRLLPGRSAK